ncbi:MAG: DUF433 domain-containing protein [Vicinamibacteria bacterium]|nr:DUF433 domain-containing protein [Vicinamibacteria bacterium]
MTERTDRRRLAHPLIVKEPGYCFGKAAIGHSRVRVNNVVCMTKQGHSLEEILESYDHLSREQVEAALAYYRDFPREIDAELARDQCSELLFYIRKAETLRLLAAREAGTASAPPGPPPAGSPES